MVRRYSLAFRPCQWEHVVMSEQADWKRVHAAAVDRIAEMGVTLKAFYMRAGISETKFRQLADGEPIVRHDKIVSLERGLGWAAGSVERVLAGGSPRVADTDDALTADVHDRLDALEAEVTRLRAQVAEAVSQAEQIAQVLAHEFGRQVGRPDDATRPGRGGAAARRRAQQAD